MRLKKRVRELVAGVAAAALVGGLVFSILTYTALRQAQEETLRLRAELDGLYTRLAGVSAENGLSAAALARDLTALREQLDGYLARPAGSAEETPAVSELPAPAPAAPAAGRPRAGGPAQGVSVGETDVPLADIETDTAPDDGAGAPEADAPAEETPAEEAPIRAGDKVVLTVTAARASDLYGYQFRLHYDDASFRYDGDLASLTPGLDTIFGKAFDGYLLVGATMVGRKKGAALEDAPVCRVTLTALRDATPESIAVDAVHVVGSDLTYAENVPGWTVTASP